MGLNVGIKILEIKMEKNQLADYFINRCKIMGRYSICPTENAGDKTGVLISY